MQRSEQLPCGQCVGRQNKREREREQQLYFASYFPFIYSTFARPMQRSEQLPCGQCVGRQNKRESNNFILLLTSLSYFKERG